MEEIHRDCLRMHRGTRLYVRRVKECDGTHSEFERRGQRMERKHRTIKKGRAEIPPHKLNYSTKPTIR